MSWIFGIVGQHLEPTTKEQATALHRANPLVDTSQIYLAADGPVETLCSHQDPSGDTGWVVAGIGFDMSSGHPSLMQPSTWEQRIHSPSPDLGQLNGHFVLIRWSQDTVTCFTDALGVRTLYLTKGSDHVAFSTRLDWLAQFSRQSALNVTAFGSYWQTFNQLSYEPLINNIQRLGPGGVATCTSRSISIQHAHWEPTMVAVGGPSISTAISSFIQPSSFSSQTCSLGLSGGVDSRYLLAHGLSKDSPLASHVFGPASHPDVQIAGQIATAFNLDHLNFYQQEVPDDLPALLIKHFGATTPLYPASSVLGLRWYDQLSREGRFVIDGGFGEIARRQFMNRLLRKDPSALSSRNPVAIYPHLRILRADIFSSEAEKLMQEGGLASLSSQLDQLPTGPEWNAEQWADLLAVRNRLPNFFGYEQNRLDASVLNFMPFAQQKVINAVFQTPLSHRRNGKRFKSTIVERAPTLGSFRLVKGNQTYPFRLSGLSTLGWTKAQAILNPLPQDLRQHTFLKTLKPFVLDHLQDISVRSDPHYDLTKLDVLVEGYYKGKHQRANELDWWIAYACWKLALKE